MSKIAIKLEISNSVNDHRSLEWFFCDTEEEKTAWIQARRKEESDWNFRTPGANSVRYYSFIEFSSMEKLLNCDMAEMEGMKLKDFLRLIKNLS